jgi:hypothetical protein
MPITAQAAGAFFASATQSATVYGSSVDFSLVIGTGSVDLEALDDWGSWVKVGTSYTTTGVYSVSHATGKLWRLNCTSVTLTSTKAITGLTKANPGVVTSTSHGLSNGTLVWIAGVGGMTEVNGKLYSIANQAANTFELQRLALNTSTGAVAATNVDTTGYTTYTSGGNAYVGAIRYGLDAGTDMDLAPRVYP